MLLWPWSQHRQHWVSFYRGELGVVALNWRSYIGVDVRRLSADWETTGEPAFAFDTYPPDPSNRLWFVPRFRHRVFNQQIERDSWEIRVPYWLIMLASAVPPIIWVRHRRDAQRAALGLCRACGYDLRATPERCPECGLEPQPALSPSKE